MANRKKENPRTTFISCRAHPDEKARLKQTAKSLGYSPSKYYRKLLGFVEDND